MQCTLMQTHAQHTSMHIKCTPTHHIVHAKSTHTDSAHADAHSTPCTNMRTDAHTCKLRAHAHSAHMHITCRADAQCTRLQSTLTAHVCSVHVHSTHCTHAHCICRHGTCLRSTQTCTVHNCSTHSLHARTPDAHSTCVQTPRTQTQQMHAAQHGTHTCAVHTQMHRARACNQQVHAHTLPLPRTP